MIFLMLLLFVVASFIPLPLQKLVFWNRKKQENGIPAFAGMTVFFAARNGTKRAFSPFFSCTQTPLSSRHPREGGDPICFLFYCQRLKCFESMTLMPRGRAALDPAFQRDDGKGWGLA